MTLIEIKPHRWGWKVFEAPGVEPVFPEKRQAISYAENRASFRSGGDSHFGFKRQCRTHPMRHKPEPTELLLLGYWDAWITSAMSQCDRTISSRELSRIVGGAVGAGKQRLWMPN